MLCDCGCGKNFADDFRRNDSYVKQPADHQNERQDQQFHDDTSVAVFTGYADIDRFLEECLETMKAKGHDYRQGNDDDILHNFRTVSETVGVDMKKVWFTYFYKHYSALSTYIKENGQQESEPIAGRVKDMIVYLLLFYRMINENQLVLNKDEHENCR